MFAVIKTGGKQYKVAADGLIEIEKVAGEAGDQVSFAEVLMVGGGDSGITVGSPSVDGATVAGEIVRHDRGGKVIAFKKRRRKNSRRTIGHRQDFTVVKITEILTDGAKPGKAKKTAKPAEDAVKPAEAAPAPKAEAAPAPEAKAADGADDLKKIEGVGPVLEKKLHGLGITTFAQIAGWSADDIARVDDELNFKGRIERDDWLGQAKRLMAESE